ncbi:Predicted flavoprotein CzcO associated with the cation diffusion facilitator CzcD [Micromonospora phaseoli]|uniref:Predicted flavoprotein CzcO associated with the cation diffusion facilitator CzcD n=1 Tax=Micromonospora phaseoli TaxID=1144548 RepID=A0A1H7DYA7_9ACTN|nr:NAD(P)/FAD-dependent oxidoreductase [Micromonospora phaseoli]PZV88994.1 cation diffusion facilitator CzcD-associated flavoprotein CzcO [Micromonospora phaseoli]GIJ80988.1 flavin-binding monooxygenase [Micromonospora phaseoli]SEK06384.1 Predicted flavoprotein CzcO associated with the cation diffusion facilitator CzcD [Micromonospora phaseoli]
MDHVDVLIVGAGLSGVGAACHLRRRCPDKTYALLEARDAVGGTWDLFRYPGVRSDSDMFTLGYSFAPWTAPKTLADGETIREYVRRTADEHDVTRHIRFRHRVVKAEWDGRQARWTVHARRDDTAETTVLTCAFLYACTGYYRYEAGYTPHLPGQERFAGRVVHPQHWPADLDHTGRQVVVIGSGATAVTLVPALAGRAAQVTMLQRSPTYLLALPSRDVLADTVRRLLPPRLAYPVVRWKNVLLATANYQLSRRAPRLVRGLLRRAVARRLPAGYDVDRHFTPRYDPWDQRLCVVPDGDLFTALSDGRAEVVTDTIDTFTEQGIRLTSGRELPADVVVTATGLELLALGGMTLRVDGVDVDPARTVAYKGMMLSGVPNFAMTVGYTNASWTLKADLVAGYVCRLLRHLDRSGTQVVTPLAPPDGPRTPLIDLSSGYVRRGVGQLPRQGNRTPWRLHQNYVRDLLLMRYGRLTDVGVRFDRADSARRSPVDA